MIASLRSPWRAACWSTLICALLAITACGRFPYVYLLNNAGTAVEILRVEADRDYFGTAEGWFGVVRIADQSGRDILYRSGDLEVSVELKIGRCSYRYVLPPTATSSNAAAVVQLEADHRLYLIE